MHMPGREYKSCPYNLTFLAVQNNNSHSLGLAQFWWEMVGLMRLLCTSQAIGGSLGVFPSPSNVYQCQGVIYLSHSSLWLPAIVSQFCSKGDMTSRQTFAQFLEISVRANCQHGHCLITITSLINSVMPPVNSEVSAY